MIDTADSSFNKSSVSPSMVIRWVVDTLLYCVVVAASTALSSWPMVTIAQTATNPMADWLAFMVLGWVINVPVLIGRAFGINALRNRSTGSVSRRNYLAISSVPTLVWFLMATESMTKIGTVIGAAALALLLCLLTYLSPVRVHKGGSLGDAV